MNEWRPLGNGLTVIEGPVVRDFGMPFPTRMTVAVLADGSVWLESPVPVSYETLTRLTELGTIKYLVANTPRHVWRLDQWHELFPEAELWAARSTAATLKRSSLPLTGTLDDQPVAGWVTDLSQQPIAGSRFIEETCFLHKPSRTLIVGDLIQVHELRAGRSFSNMIKRVGGVAGPVGGTSIDIRLSFWDRQALRESTQRVLDWEFDNVVLAHGPCVIGDAKPFLENAFAWALE